MNVERMKIMDEFIGSNSEEKALAFATLIHTGQKDKDGKPYIFHCIRVRENLDFSFIPDISEMAKTNLRVMALLHDVYEDAPLSEKDSVKEELTILFGGTVVNIICDYLSRNKKEDYSYYLNKMTNSPFAMVVKYADLIDNSDITRLSNPTPEDYKRVDKYYAAMGFIEQSFELQKYD